MGLWEWVSILESGQFTRENERIRRVRMMWITSLNYRYLTAVETQVHFLLFLHKMQPKAAEFHQYSFLWNLNDPYTSIRPNSI